MSRLIPLLAALALAGCSTPSINCAHADRVRAAATLALQTLDRVCPSTRLYAGGI